MSSYKQEPKRVESKFVPNSGDLGPSLLSTDQLPCPSKQGSCNEEVAIQEVLYPPCYRPLLPTPYPEFVHILKSPTEHGRTGPSRTILCCGFLITHHVCIYTYMYIDRAFNNRSIANWSTVENPRKGSLASWPKRWLRVSLEVRLSIPMGP